MRSKKLRKEVKENTIPFWAQPTSRFEFHSTEAQKIKGEKMEEILGFQRKLLVTVAFDSPVSFDLTTTQI